jgi:hypothetical protein
MLLLALEFSKTIGGSIQKHQESVTKEAEKFRTKKST